MADLFERTYLLAFISLPLVAVIGVVSPFFFGMGNLGILGLYLAVPMTLAAGVLWRLGKPRESGPLESTAVNWRVFSVLFHLTVAALIVSLTTYDVRPLGFHVGLAFLYVLVMLLIWVPEPDAGHTSICLYHTTVTVVLAIFSVTLKYDFFVGNTDLTAHVSMINLVVDTGEPAATALYGPFQLWHIYVASTYQLLGGYVPTHTVTYVLSGLVFGTGVFAAYGLANRIYPGERVALLTAFFTIANPFYVFYGMYSIPRSITSVLFLTLLLTLVGRSSSGLRIIGVTFVLAIVLYHPVSIPFVFVILLVTFGIEYVVRSRPEAANQPVIVDNVTLLIIGLITLTYWMYSAPLLVETIARSISIALTGSGDETTPVGVVASPLAEGANYVAYSFFVFFLLIGALLWLRDERGKRAAFGVFGLTTLLLVPLSVPGPTLLLDGLAGINVDRFGHYTFMFLSLTAAVGAYQLLRRGGMRLFVAFLLLTSVFAFTAVSNDFVARDNPAVERPFYTYYLTEQERHAYERLEATYVGEIETDRPTCRYMAEMLRTECTVIDVEAEEEMFNGAESILIRHGELEDRPLQFSTYVSAEDIPREELTDRNKVYDSESVSLHV